MTDKQTVTEMLSRAGVRFEEEKHTITVVSVYQSFDHPLTEGDIHIHTLFEFDVDGELITCRAYKGEGY